MDDKYTRKYLHYQSHITIFFLKHETQILGMSL